MRLEKGVLGANRAQHYKSPRALLSQYLKYESNFPTSFLILKSTSNHPHYFLTLPLLGVIVFVFTTEGTGIEYGDNTQSYRD